MFSWRAEVRPGVWVAFTDTAAGNLALHVGDDPAAVQQRRGRLAETAGLDSRGFRFMNQVHGNDVAVVCAAGEPAAGTEPGPAPTADALVAAGEPLAVLVADCVPVVLVGEGPADGAAPVFGAVHAGRPGMAAGVIPAAVARMRELGAVNIAAWIGPSICGQCYEVPESLRAEVAAVVPAAWCITAQGTPGLDLPAGVRSQLAAEGVAVEYSGGCTREDEKLFSYRRNKSTGRFAGLVWSADATEAPAPPAAPAAAEARR
ncbi:polyphenol oxidase family protein [Arthrobacter sp. B3I4]|uniref:polyphenol oxidase family protein n=1 Tax=Arthrobacter sp. B3I4 TaxID=3042267 RepID=UPI0027828918|nr:polyphenol oxidase family protein [Arthrobacter sp. B3I4]MDQ0756791.1 YfiH family protein [Arthrobacter sp. B3I4]